MIYKYSIIWSPKAYKDLKSIYHYIKYSLNEKTIANNLISKILNEVWRLGYFPERYPMISIPHFKIKNIRKMVINNYLIVYEVNNNIR